MKIVTILGNTCEYEAPKSTLLHKGTKFQVLPDEEWYTVPEESEEPDDDATEEEKEAYQKQHRAMVPESKNSANSLQIRRAVSKTPEYQEIESMTIPKVPLPKTVY